MIMKQKYKQNNKDNKKKMKRKLLPIKMQNCRKQNNRNNKNKTKLFHQLTQTIRIAILPNHLKI